MSFFHRPTSYTQYHGLLKWKRSWVFRRFLRIGWTSKPEKPMVLDNHEDQGKAGRSGSKKFPDPLGWSLICRVMADWWFFATPLKNMTSSVGMISNPIYGKIKLMFQTTNQMGIPNKNIMMAAFLTGLPLMRGVKTNIKHGSKPGDHGKNMWIENKDGNLHINVPLSHCEVDTHPTHQRWLLCDWGRSWTHGVIFSNFFHWVSPFQSDNWVWNWRKNPLPKMWQSWHLSKWSSSEMASDIQIIPYGLSGLSNLLGWFPGNHSSSMR